MAWLKSKKSSVSDLGLPDEFFDIEDYSRLCSLRASGEITEEQNEELERIIRSNPKLAELEQARIDNLNKLITDSEYSEKFEKTMNELWRKVEELMKAKPATGYESLFPKDEEVEDEFGSAVRGDTPKKTPDIDGEELSEFAKAVKEAEEKEAAMAREASVSEPPASEEAPLAEDDGSLDVSEEETPKVSPDLPKDSESEEESEEEFDETEDEEAEELDDGALDPIASDPPEVDPEEEERNNTPIERSEALDFLYNLHMEKKAKEEHPEPDPPTVIRLMDKDFEVGLDLQNNVDINKAVFDYYENNKFGDNPEADINTLTHLHMLSKLDPTKYAEIVVDRDQSLDAPTKTDTMPEGATLNNLIFYGEIEAFTNAYLKYSELIEKESLTDEEKEKLKNLEDYLLLVLQEEAKRVTDIDGVLKEIDKFEEENKDDLTPMNDLIRKAYEQEKKYRTEGRKLSHLENSIITKTAAEYNDLLDKYGFELGKEIDLDILTPEEKRLYAGIKLYERNCEDIFMRLSSKDVLTEQEEFELSKCRSSLIVIANVEASHLENLEEIVKEAEENRDLLTPIREATLAGYRLALVSKKAKGSTEEDHEPAREEAPAPEATPTPPEPAPVSPTDSTPREDHSRELPDLEPEPESDLPDLVPEPESELPDLEPEPISDLPDLSSKEESHKDVPSESEHTRASDKVIPIRRRTVSSTEDKPKSDELEEKIISTESKTKDKPASEEADKLMKARELASHYKAFQEGLKELGLSSFDDLASVLGKVEEIGEDKEPEESGKSK